jgi:hypothetical protein
MRKPATYPFAFYAKEVAAAGFMEVGQNDEDSTR